MAILFTCTGRKKSVAMIVAFFQELHKKKEVVLLARKQTTKKVAFWKYEELKILFLKQKPGKLQIEEKLLKNVDYAAMEHKSTISVKMSSFQTEDDWLKCNIMTLTGGFQLKGGHLQIKEDITYQV